jgi:glycosyltransferase involved in cell wall biosynthesis
MGSVDVSVIVRSFNRLPSLCELVGALLEQETEGATFEIVIVEQSTEVPAPASARLTELGHDPRIRILRHPPLGGPRARNVGVRASRGDILLFMDDDDLPDGTGWIAAHVRNYRDPACLGVSGRHVIVGSAARGPYRNLAKARRQVLSYTPLLMWPRGWPRCDRPRKVELWMGGNSSLRRETVSRFGLWDECTTIEDELSFCFRLRAGKRDHEYLMFDSEATMLRRLDIPGGMNKRAMGPVRYMRRLSELFHHVIGHYFPMRLALMYPAYVVLAYVVTLDWIWNEFSARGSWVRRLGVSGGLVAALPFIWIGWLAKLVWCRFADGPIEHAPRLELGT